jgi:hypothetical protein
MTKHSNLTEVASQINILKHKMIDTGLNKGLNSPETLTYSKMLDKLIYNYQLLTKFQIRE